MKKSVFFRYEINFVVSLAVAMALRQLAMVMILPFMSVYGKTLLYSTPALVGIAIGIYGLIQGIMQMPFGSLSDKIGRKNVITIDSLFLAIGLASMWNVFLPATLIGIVIMIVSSKVADRGKSGMIAFFSFVCVLFGGALTGALWGGNHRLPQVFIVLASVLGCILVRRLKNADNNISTDEVKVPE